MSLIICIFEYRIRGQITRQYRVMRTVKYFASMVMLLALISGCKKDRDNAPDPTPTPDPNPTITEVSVSLTNGGIIRAGKLVSEWTSGDKVSLWGYTSESNNPIKLIASFKNNRQWSLNNNTPKDWNKTGKLFIGYLPLAHTTQRRRFLHLK